MVLGIVIVYGVENSALHYPMVAIVAVIVTTNFAVILQLAQPYAGDVSTTSAAGGRSPCCRNPLARRRLTPVFGLPPISLT